MSDFMRLPREVRDMIYEEALCVDGAIAPYKESYKVDGDHEGPLPTIALLSTCKQIRNEALPVLFGKNTWRVSVKAKETCLCCMKPDEDVSLHNCYPESIWDHFNHLFRKIRLDYHFQEGDHDRAAFVTWVNERSSANTPHERMHLLHDNFAEHLSHGWLDKTLMILYMDLTCITVNVQNLYCPFGCCRTDVVERLFACITRMYDDEPTPFLTADRLEVLGVKGEEEEMLVEMMHDRRKVALYEHEAYCPRCGTYNSSGIDSDDEEEDCNEGDEDGSNVDKAGKEDDGSKGVEEPEKQASKHDLCNEDR